MRRVLLAGLGLLAVLVAGCTSGGSESGAATLPPAPTVLNNAGASMRGVTSVHFTITVNGTLPGVPVQNATGDLNAQGQAKGSAKLTELGQLVQVDFVLVDKVFYLKGPTGGYQRIPAALAGSLFDPTAILDPNRGVAKLLTSVRGGTTQARETVDGVDCYRVGGKVDNAVVAALLPGISSDVTATIWVAADSRNLPVKAEFTVPGTGGGKGATVDVDISNVDAPVTVTAPA
jgi:lipoprotein LprG